MFEWSRQWKVRARQWVWLAATAALCAALGGASPCAAQHPARATEPPSPRPNEAGLILPVSKWAVRATARRELRLVAGASGWAGGHSRPGFSGGGGALSIGVARHLTDWVGYDARLHGLVGVGGSFEDMDHDYPGAVSRGAVGEVGGWLSLVLGPLYPAGIQFGPYVAYGFEGLGLGLSGAIVGAQFAPLVLYTGYDHEWSIAVVRITFGKRLSVDAPVDDGTFPDPMASTDLYYSFRFAEVSYAFGL